MEMKWHPIEDGDLSGIPINEEFLFTVFDEIDDQTYVIKGLVTNGWPESNPYKVLETTVRGCSYYKAKKVKAWMELPSPFHPNDCNMCAHYMVWTDEFGDRWSKCKLWNEPFAMDDCPWLDEEYTEPPKQEVDWNEVPVDTLVRVRNYEDEEWLLMYFKGINENHLRRRYEAWESGATSKTAEGKYLCWEYCELVEDEDNGSN